jgi:hypothetical protein
VSSSSVYGSYLPEDAADLSSTGNFMSENTGGQWISYDFGAMLVRPTSYTLRSINHVAGLNRHTPKAWEVSGSVNWIDWKLIDKQGENHALYEWASQVSHPISTLQDFRYIRVTQVGVNHEGCNYFGLSAFEIDGTLISPQKLETASHAQ